MLCVAAWVWFCLSTEFVVVPSVREVKKLASVVEAASRVNSRECTTLIYYI